MSFLFLTVMIRMNPPNSLGTGYVAFPQRVTGLCLLQAGAVLLLAHRKLQHVSLSGALASGVLQARAGFGAEAPLGPVAELAVSGEEAGSDGRGQVRQWAQTAT